MRSGEVAPISRRLFSGEGVRDAYPEAALPGGVSPTDGRAGRAGRGVAELAREFGCNARSIHHWVNAERGGKAGGCGGRGVAVSADAPLTPSERQELQELFRKLKQVQMERDMLAKATAWFAGKSERMFTTSSNS